MKKLQILLLFLAIIYTNNTNAQTAVYITKTGEKYHKENCRLLYQEKAKTTIKKARLKGYVACNVCKPKENVKNSKAKKQVVKEGKSNKVILKKGASKNTIATRCTGTTQKGTRCKRTTKNKSGKCWQHN